MKITSKDQRISSKVQETKNCVATSGLPERGHGTVRCHTLDYPVHQGTVAQRLVPGGTMEEHTGLSSLSGATPDCLV
jgi:hypothetical protein